MTEGTPQSEPEGTRTPDRLYPFSTKTLQTVFYLLLLGWTGWLLAMANEWDGDDKLFPFVVGVPLCLLVTTKLLKLYSQRTASSTANKDNETESILEHDGDESSRSVAVKQRYELTMLVWVVALPVASYYLGFVPVVPVFIFGFLWYYQRDAKLAVAVALAGSITLYLLFAFLLDVSLWKGTVDTVSGLMS